MTTNTISGFGTKIAILALGTFPQGFVVEQFGDDSDPLDIGSIKLGDTAMGLNGDLIRWSKAVPIPMVVTVIPGSDADTNLGILAEANRVGQGKVSSDDEITATVIYPDGRQITFVGGAITDAALGYSISSAGRYKTKSYSFSFQNKVGI